MSHLPPAPVLVTDEEREAIMRAQVRAAASAKIVAALHPKLVEVRATCQQALKARPAPPDTLTLACTASAPELIAAIKAHRRYASSGTLSLLRKSRAELGLILSNLDPAKAPVRETSAITSDRFLRTARLVERRAEIERLQARAAEAAARAAATAAAAADRAVLASRPLSFWQRPRGGGAAGGSGEGAEEEGLIVREKTAEERQREREAHQRRYWKLTDAEALAMAKAKYAAHRF